MKTSRKAYVVVVVIGKIAPDGAMLGRHYSHIAGVFTKRHPANMCAAQYDRNPGRHASVVVHYMNDGRVDLSGC
jgi:hypothetical protein